MRRLILKQSKEALANALQGLETVRLTPQNDPVLSELKEVIRRTIESDRELVAVA